jgi:hypothetical protein
VCEYEDQNKLFYEEKLFINTEVEYDTQFHMAAYWGIPLPTYDDLPRRYKASKKKPPHLFGLNELELKHCLSANEAAFRNGEKQERERAINTNEGDAALRDLLIEAQKKTKELQAKDERLQKDFRRSQKEVQDLKEKNKKLEETASKCDRYKRQRNQADRELVAVTEKLEQAKDTIEKGGVESVVAKVKNSPTDKEVKKTSGGVEVGNHTDTATKAKKVDNEKGKVEVVEEGNDDESSDVKVILKDKHLPCQDCKASFTHTAERQELFAQKQYKQPKRCAQCAAKNNRGEKAKKAQKRTVAGTPRNEIPKTKSVVTTTNKRHKKA